MFLVIYKTAPGLFTAKGFAFRKETVIILVGGAADGASSQGAASGHQHILDHGVLDQI